MRVSPLALLLAALTLSACQGSDNSRAAEAVADDSEYGVITAPQLGHLPDQPNITGQVNVTTATTATSPTSTLGGSANQAAGETTQTNGAKSTSTAASSQ